MKDEFAPPHRDPVGPDQESVWDFPRPAVAQHAAVHLRVVLAGRTIAETRRGVRTIETSHPPTYYFPPDDIAAGALVRCPGSSLCEWKGAAIYFDVVADDLVRPRAAWCYPHPTAAFAPIRDHVAFYAAAMDACFVDGERVVPQPGGFYGGWISSRVAGPFKGVPGEPLVVSPVAVVIGAGGGIGGALVERLRASARFGAVHALSRRPSEGRGAVRTGFVDVTDEASVAAAAARIGAPVDLVIVATGLLHEDARMPEKALRELDPATLARLFAINAIGPAIVLKHFAPLLAKDRRAVIAALSARVGSISDNRGGGWYGYRASKAALNMIVKTAAIELARTRPQAVCVALHPGTVDTALSRPFQARVPAERLFAPDRAAGQLLDVIDGLGPADSGGLFAWDGRPITP